MVRANAKDVKVGGGGLLGVGKHHAIIIDPPKVDTKYGTQVVLKVQSLASDPTTEAGKSRLVYLDCDGEYAGRVWEAAIACGLTTKEAFEAAQASPEGAGDLDEAEFEGREALIEIREYFKKDKATRGETTEKGEAVNWIPWADARAKHFPRDNNSPLMKAMAASGNGNGGAVTPEPVGAGAGASANATAPGDDY